MLKLFRSRKVVFAALAVSGILTCAIGFAAEIRIGLVLDKGGKDDKSFNSSAYQGAMRAKEELNSYVKYVEATDDNAFEPLLRAFAQKKFDLVIAVGFSQADAVTKIAKQFPDQKFALVDAEAHPSNVRSLLFEEHEGSYLMGAIAAMTSKTGKIGFIGGMDIPLIRRFERGYESGAKAVNSKVQVITNYVGVTTESWNNPTKAKELALTQYLSGADVIFGAAGGSGAGLFDAAEEMKKFVIGVDSNQNGVKPGNVLTSMVKRVDQAVFLTCKDVVEGKFTGGVRRYGLANQGIDYVVDSNNEKILSIETRKKADELKSKIISGKILVPDYYKLKK